MACRNEHTGQVECRNEENGSLMRLDTVWYCKQERRWFEFCDYKHTRYWLWLAAGFRGGCNWWWGVMQMQIRTIYDYYLMSVIVLGWQWRCCFHLQHFYFLSEDSWSGMELGRCFISSFLSAFVFVSGPPLWGGNVTFVAFRRSVYQSFVLSYMEAAPLPNETGNQYVM